MTISIDSTLFYANWCGHCVDFKSEWGKFKEMIEQNGGKYKGMKISSHEYEDSALPSGGAKILNKDIKGYPTIKITITSGNKSTEYEYDGKRNADELFYHITEKAIKNL